MENEELTRYEELRRKKLSDMTASEVSDLHELRKNKEQELRDSYDSTYIHGRIYETSYHSFLMDNKPKTIPNVAISPVTHLIQGFNFILTLNNFTYGFKEISGFKLENPVDYIPEGGVNDHQLIVGKPSDETPTLECRRGLMIRSAPVWSNASRALAAMVPNNLGRKAALMAVNVNDPQATLEQGPALGTIEVYDINKRLCAMYTFMSLGMRSWECDGLSADNSGILIESITIAHTGLTRVPLGAPNTLLGYVPMPVEEQPTPEYSTKDWAAYDLERLLGLQAQAEHLKDQADTFKKQKEALEKAKEDRKKNLEKLKKAYADLAENLKAADEKAKEDADQAVKDAQDKKVKDAEEREEQKAKRKEQLDTQAESEEALLSEREAAAKEAGSKTREEVNAAYEAEVEKQKEATEKADAERKESDEKTKRQELTKEERQQQLEDQQKAEEESFSEREAAAKEAGNKTREEVNAAYEAEVKEQKEASEKADAERKESDENAKDQAETNRSEAKDKAKQAEAKKQSGSK